MAVSDATSAKNHEWKYRKLPGTGTLRGVLSAGRVRLWLGPDHLLAVENRGVEESYKRFYFSDIRSITVRRTSTWLKVGVSFSLSALISGGGIYPLVTYSDGGQISMALASVLFVISAACAIVGLIALLRGPSCRTELRTAVQVEDLVSLGRMRTTRRALATIVPLIDQAQGALTPDQLSNPVEVSAPTAPVKDALAPERTGKAANIGFILLSFVLIADAIFGFAYAAMPGVLKGVENVGYSIAMGEIGLGALGLFKSRGSVGVLVFRIIAVLSILLGISSIVIGIVLAVLAAPQILAAAQSGKTFNYSSIPGFLPAVLITSSIAAVLGVMGLTAWLVSRRTTKAGM